MESFFSSLKTERAARRTYRAREEAKADVFDYIERFYNGVRAPGRTTLSRCHPKRMQASSPLCALFIQRPLKRIAVSDFFYAVRISFHLAAILFHSN
jgi:hypothetical protein